MKTHILAAEYTSLWITFTLDFALLIFHPAANFFFLPSFLCCPLSSSSFLALFHSCLFPTSIHFSEIHFMSRQVKIGQNRLRWVKISQFLVGSNVKHFGKEVFDQRLRSYWKNSISCLDKIPFPVLKIYFKPVGSPEKHFVK